MQKKFFRQIATMIFVVAFTISTAVQMFDGKGEWHTNDDDNQQIAMSRAQQRAQLDAQKKAGVYLKTFSRTVNLELADDVISAVTNNIIEIVGDVHFDKKIIPLSESQTTILYTATLKAKIDPEGIYDWINRDETDKVKIVQQNNDLQDAIQKNDELSASLTEQYNRATSQAEKDKIRKQMNDADRDFLANQKLDEGNKLAYAKDYNGAIKFYDEALQLNPNFADAYYNRGCAYFDLGQYERAIQDFDKSIELNPNYADAYYNRGCAYFDLGQYERAIQDYDKTIEINPNYADAYYNRGLCYSKLKNYEQAIQNLNKAIQFDNNNPLIYEVRSVCHQQLGDEAKAQADFAKAKELGYKG